MATETDKDMDMDMGTDMGKDMNMGMDMGRAMGMDRGMGMVRGTRIGHSQLTERELPRWCLPQTSMPSRMLTTCARP